MYSQTDLDNQRQKMLIRKIQYLREEKILANMSIHDFKLRTAVVADIIATIKRCGMELGGHPEAVYSSQDRSGEASAVDTGSTGGC